MQQYSPLDSKRRHHNVVSKMMNKGEMYSCELGLGQCSSLSSGCRSTEIKYKYCIELEAWAVGKEIGSTLQDRE